MRLCSCTFVLMIVQDQASPARLTLDIDNPHRFCLANLPPGQLAQLGVTEDTDWNRYVIKRWSVAEACWLFETLFSTHTIAAGERLLYAADGTPEEGFVDFEVELDQVVPAAVRTPPNRNRVSTTRVTSATPSSSGARASLKRTLSAVQAQLNASTASSSPQLPVSDVNARPASHMSSGSSSKSAMPSSQGSSSTSSPFNPLWSGVPESEPHGEDLDGAGEDSGEDDSDMTPSPWPDKFTFEQVKLGSERMAKLRADTPKGQFDHKHEFRKQFHCKSPKIRTYRENVAWITNAPETLRTSFEQEHNKSKPFPEFRLLAREHAEQQGGKSKATARKRRRVA